MYKTAESVTPKHPDKLCDRISDAILDAALAQDPDSRVAIETMGGHGIITITGEMTTKAYVNIQEVARTIVGEKYGIQTNIVQQSPEISAGVDTGGAGDQGIMVGYACNENEAMIPQELYLARELCKAIYKEFPYDGKTQVTIDGKAITHIVASFQNTTSEQLEDEVRKWLGNTDGMAYNGSLVIHTNPAGDWNIGGFEADTGLTGRKLAVDTYGPNIPIGGGAFSGKDPSKVDRSGAYMARKCAVVILKERKAKEVIVKLSYAIGLADPVMAIATVDGVEEQLLPLELLTPRKIIETLDLKKPIYERTAQWGHFGNGFQWDS